MPENNVLSLNAFGEIIEPKKKRQYATEAPPQDVETPQEAPQRIPLTLVSPEEKPVILPSDREETQETPKGNKKSNHVASKILMHMAQTKLLHWQTYSLAEHKSLDKLFGDLVDLGDELVESVMGKYGRPELTKEESTLSLTNYENPESPDGLPRFLEEIDSCFRKECSSLFSEEEDPEIHNLIQEILGKIDKISYLLTLRK